MINPNLVKENKSGRHAVGAGVLAVLNKTTSKKHFLNSGV
jgi:hypothetical protein